MKTFATAAAYIIGFFTMFLAACGFALGIAAIETGALPIVEFANESAISSAAFMQLVFLTFSLCSAAVAWGILRSLDRRTGIAC